MEFRLDDTELRELAQIETETNCNIGAGFDWGPGLGDQLAQAITTVNHTKLLAILQESLGEVLSQEELEDAAREIQAQLRDRVLTKLSSQDAIA